MNAIETEYNGYRFRSRLEARWAVFFDTVGLEYEYEPEGYETAKGQKYLPDFYLPGDCVYVEVKADRPGAGEELMKAFDWVAESKELLLVLSCVPYRQDCSVWWYPCAYYHPMRKRVLGAYAVMVDADNVEPYIATDYYAGHGLLKPIDGSVRDLSRWLTPINDKDIPYCDDFTVNNSFQCNKIAAALTMARRARFEHGEKGGKQ